MDCFSQEVLWPSAWQASAAALFVFFAAATGAGVVTADLDSGA